MENTTQEVTGTATIRVRNLTIENVRVTRLPNGEFNVPFKLTDIRFLDPKRGNTKGGGTLKRQNI